MKKKFLAVIFTVTLAGSLLTGCQSSSTQESGQESGDSEQESEESGDSFTGEGLNEATTIRIGYVPVSANNLENMDEKYQWFEEEFEEDGISVEWVSFQYGAPLVESLTAGNIDIGTNIGDTPFITAVANQAPIQAITQTAGDVYFAFSVVISPGQKDSINETADLKGKKIGYAVGSSAQSFLVKYLASADLTLDDVESVNLSTTQDMVAALSTNDIDALIALEPVGTMVVNSLDTKQLEYEQGLNYTVGVGVVNTDFAAANPDLVVRYLQIADKYNQQIESDPEEFKEIASQSLEVDAENLVTIDRFQFPLGFGKEAESALQETVDFLVDTGVLESEVDLTGTYTNKYADEVKRRGDE